MSQLIDQLREIYKVLDNGKKETIKKTVEVLQGYVGQIGDLEEKNLALESQIADLQAQLEARPLPEAAGSINLRMVAPDTGAVAQFTFRYHSDAKAIAAWPLISKELASLGLVSEDSYRHQERATPPTATNGPALPPVANGQPPANHSGEELSFEAKELVGERKKGKNYWKVLGGKYVKHGVTIWEEVLTAAGFNFKDLNPDTVYNLSGYTAFYEMDEEGKNPRKVIRLERR